MDGMLEVVFVPVSDIDRAKSFYAEQLGFLVDYDSTYREDYRVVQVTPPGSGCSVVLGSGAWSWMQEGGPALRFVEPGALQALTLVVSDVEAARTGLIERGVSASDVLHFEEGEWRPQKGGPWNSFVFFQDPDGNGWMLQERPPQD